MSRGGVLRLVSWTATGILVGGGVGLLVGMREVRAGDYLPLGLWHLGALTALDGTTWGMVAGGLLALLGAAARGLLGRRGPLAAAIGCGGALAAFHLNLLPWFPAALSPGGTALNGLLLGATLAGAWAVVRGAGPETGGPQRGRGRGRGIAAALLAAGLAIGRHGLETGGDAARPSILLITVDTLRADRVGAYGYARPTTPQIDALAREGIVFENAFAQSSLTPPSHASILTALYPSTHGLITWNRLAPERVTLAELLADAGYATGAFVNLGLLSEQGLGQGFQTQVEGYYGPGDLLSDRLLYGWDRPGRGVFPAAELTRKALRWVDHHRGRPFFLWVHYYDCHSPYGATSEHATLFNRDGPRHVGESMSDYNLDPPQLAARGFGEREIAFMRDRYDGGVAYCDREIGKFLSGLRRRGLADNLVIVLTADHGESLGEREEMLFAHDPFLYEEVTRVPLILRLPARGGAGRRVRGIVESVDILPTLCHLAEVAPPEGIAGRDLREAVGGGGGREFAVSECWGWRYRKAVRTPQFRYIEDLQQGRAELYDLVADPSEERDLLAENPSGATPLTTLLSEWRARHPESTRPEEVRLGEDLQERLRALGYVR